MRLTPDALSAYHGAARLPDYDRAAVTPGILHLGIGAFHRAHQAAAIDSLLGQDPSWGILGVSLRRPGMAEALGPQSGLYLLGERGPDGLSARVIGAVLGVIDASADAAEVIARMADPAIRLVTITVTEKGYCSAAGRLDADHGEVAADLAGRPPRSLPGILCAGLAAHRAAGLGPITLLSCDNLAQNGAVLKAVVRDYAALSDRSLHDWLTVNTAFPSSMVDRITPATTDADRADLARLTGLKDAWPVVTEPFSQWVIEDLFPAGRPPFEAAGVEMVADVTPFEDMKLRLLNGAHSTLAYWGQLRGHELVSEAVADPVIVEELDRSAHEEVFPTLDLPRNTLEPYWADLMTRFANPGIRHRLAQIAMDGTQKLPQRLLAPLAESLAAGRPAPGLTRAVAAWVVWTGRRLARGETPEDPRAAELGPLARGTPEDRTAALCALPGLLPTTLAENPTFRTSLAAAITELERA